jgi:hypothetical protein
MSRQSEGIHEGNGDSIPAHVEEDQVATRLDGRWAGKDEADDFILFLSIFLPIFGIGLIGQSLQPKTSLTPVS